MSRRCGFALLMLMVPGLVFAQEAPEDLLPAGAQIYIRWDGIDAHRAAYEKTALGKMMQGDTGKFVSGSFGQLQDALGAALTVQQLLGGVAPEKLQKLQADAKEAPKLLDLLSQNGFVLAAEVRKLEPPEGQVFLVVPNAGAKPAPVFASLRLAATLAGIEIKEKKVGNRAVHEIDTGFVRVAWWAEGKHALVVAGTDPVEVVLKRMEDEKARLTGSPLFKKVREFKQFETGARAFVDVASVNKMAKTRGKEVAQLIDELGLDGLNSLAFYSGFDGLYERSLVEVDMPASRKGALKLLGGKPFRLSDVPPLPADVVSWSMTNFEWVGFHDIALKAVEGGIRLAAPDALLQFKDALKQMDLVLGVNLRNDLLAALGDQFLAYTSPAEGPLSLGQTLLFKVKDPKKLNAALDQVIGNIAKTTGADVSIKKKTYRGVELHEVHFQQQGFFFVPTYAIHKDWLVVAYFPQPVQGFILRASGELPAWKPDPRLQESLDKMPKEFVSISVTDPVPSLKQLLSLAPMVAALMNNLTPDIKFDVSSVPNAHEATRHLFPNVSIVTDDGKTLRQETRASLALPFDLTGLDTYALFFVFAFSRGFGF